MVRHKLKLYTYHSFLVIPFIVLFLFAHNLDITKAEMTYRTLIIGIGLSILLYLLTQLLMKNRLKTGIFVTLVLFGLFQYGVIYEFFESLYYKGYWPLNNIHRYLIVTYCIVILTLFILIKKTKHDLLRINYFLNALIIILLVFNLLIVSFGNYGKKNTASTTRDPISQSIKFNDKTFSPNIYYIILDGYAGNTVLNKYYHFQNTEFVNFLKNKNFTFCDSAFSNYYFTSSSLAATLNFDFLNDSISQSDQIGNNRLFSSLKNNKYKICHMKSGYAVTGSFSQSDATIGIDGPNEFEKSLLKHTILRLDDLIGFFAYNRLKSQFKKMFELVEIKADPKFCFLHIVAPHPPFIFDRKGNIRAKHQFAEHSWEPKEFYVDQLIYVNTQIEKLVAEILKKDSNSTIIIQSDHGPWINGENQEEVFEARSNILYAYYSKKTLQVPNKTSSVNTFRYVLNGLFDCQLPILSDEYAGKEVLMKDPIFTKKVKKK